uniref:Uncharacterized protein n=1 Tax=Pithovirus LCPAC406 TaxID=2506599 RepID=A0A481ZI52_9VIRU|nr:MAG: hypothetical protein LCPAC406_01750 [Pithovirus LCPAC406]
MNGTMLRINLSRKDEVASLEELCRTTENNMRIVLLNVKVGNKKVVVENLLPSIINGYKQNSNPLIIFTVKIENNDFIYLEDEINEVILSERKESNLRNVDILVKREGEIITLIEAMDANIYQYYGADMLRSEAHYLYRTRVLEQCKLGVTYDLAALYLKESRLENWFLNRFREEKIAEFQKDYNYASELFEMLLREKNCF